MGRHLGYRATEEPNGTWKAWARDPVAQAYRKQSGFLTEAKALKHAKDQHARYLTRQESAQKCNTRALADEYVSFLTVVKKRKPSHLANVRRAMAGLVIAAPDITHSRAPTAYEEWLAEQPIAPSTKRQYLVTARAMAKWALKRKKLVGMNPLAAVETEDVPKTLKAQFAVAELRSMVTAWDDPYHLRAAVLIYLGGRIEECSELWWDDIDLASRRVKFHRATKGGKERLTPIPEECAAILAHYAPAPMAGPMFPERQAGLWREFQAFLSRIRTVPRAGRSPHSTRHTYAGIQTATGVNSLGLALNMGHESMATTKGYAKLASGYAHAVKGWASGDIVLITGLSCPLPKE